MEDEIDDLLSSLLEVPPAAAGAGAAGPTSADQAGAGSSGGDGSKSGGGGASGSTQIASSKKGVKARKMDDSELAQHSSAAADFISAVDKLSVVLCCMCLR